MKRIFIFLACFVATLQTEAKSLVVVLTNGTLAYYEISKTSEPVMKRGNGTIMVNTDGYNLSEFHHFYVRNEDVPASISGIKTDGTRYEGTYFYVKSDDKKVSVYSTDGKEMNMRFTINDGWTIVPMGNLRSGVYIVKVGESSFKIRKR